MQYGDRAVTYNLKELRALRASTAATITGASNYRLAATSKGV